MKRHFSTFALMAALSGMAVATVSDAEAQGRGGRPTNPGASSMRPAAPSGAPAAARAGRTDVRGSATGFRALDNPKLAETLQARLPAGVALADAADGFRNLGQFVAAVNVAHNVDGVTFDGLKAAMTAEEPVSLGEAIRQQKADVNADAIAHNAEIEAADMIETASK